MSLDSPRGSRSEERCPWCPSSDRRRRRSCPRTRRCTWRGPPRLRELEDLVPARAFAGLDGSHRRRVVAVLHRRDRGLITLRELERRGLRIVERDPLREDPRERAEYAEVGVVVLVDPESG